MNIFEQKFTVDLSDITPNFGMKLTAVLKYYQETLARYCAKHNVAGYNVYQMGLKWVLGQTVVGFGDIIPIWNEEIISKVYISNVKKLRIYFNFEIETKRGLVAKGQSVAYLLDLETSRPKPVNDVVDKFMLNKDDLNGEIIESDFQIFDNKISEKTHKITISDIDYNNHTNNISYVIFAFEGVPEKYIKEKFPKFINIKYVQETFLNDELNCVTTQNDDCFNCKITKNNSDVCFINSYFGNDNMNVDDFYNVLKKVRE